MADEKNTLSVKIGNDSFSIKVNADESKVYEDAIDLVNSKLVEYQKGKPRESDIRHLSLVALDLAIHLIRENTYNNDDFEKLRLIDSMLGDFLKENNG